MVNPLIPRQKSHIVGDYIFCRYRRTRDGKKLLDAQEYGYKAWRIPLKSKK